MDVVAKALWFIEIEMGRDLTLDRIATICEVSRFGLPRSFAINTGWPVMRYIRARRLSRAARELAQGAPDILSVALDTGYGSHETFTRAFHDLFGITPERVRAGRNLDGLSLLEQSTDIWFLLKSFYIARYETNLSDQRIRQTHRPGDQYGSPLGARGQADGQAPAVGAAVL